MRVWLLAALCSGLYATQLCAGEIIQHFPANGPVAAMDTRWRIVWGVEQHGGRSEVLYIREAHFQRGPGSPEIQVLGDCRLAEIFVPYNGGTRIYDISNYTFPLITLDPSFLGPVCVGPGVIYDREGVPGPSGPVASEVHDGQLRWINGANKHRRGQSIAVWSVLSAGNYRYIMLYQFRDDGVVSFRLGATAHNLFDSDGDGTTHLHTGWWRLNVVLGAAARTQVSLVELDTSALSSAVTLLGKESRLEWNAERFSRLRVESLVHFNAHSPSHPIGYELIPMRQGNGRYLGVGEEFTQHEFWVTRAPQSGAEIRPRDLPAYENDEALAENPIVIWHNAPVLHAARDEDFGIAGTNAGEGVAITAWAGFELKPRQFFDKTPLYP